MTSSAQRHRLVKSIAAVALFQPVMLVLGAGDEVMFSEFGDVAIAEAAGGGGGHCKNG